MNDEEFIEELKKKLEEIHESMKDLIGPPMFWEEYLEWAKDWFGPDAPEKLEKIRKIIEENNLYGMTGVEYQHSKWFQIIFEETGVKLSQRAWGRLMASLMNSRIGERRYTYVSYAW